MATYDADDFLSDLSFEDESTDSRTADHLYKTDLEKFYRPKLSLRMGDHMFYYSGGDNYYVQDAGFHILQNKYPSFFDKMMKLLNDLVKELDPDQQYLVIFRDLKEPPRKKSVCCNVRTKKVKIPNVEAVCCIIEVNIYIHSAAYGYLQKKKKKPSS